MLSRYERAVLQFSGGKDSTALIYLARPHLDRITVLFSDTGAVYPHVLDFVHETCRKLGATLEVVRPALDVLAYTAINGLPADIVPVESLPQMAPRLREKPAQLVQGYMACCSAMIFEPMARAVRKSGAKIVLRGSKGSDARVGVKDRHIEDGIEYRSPLWHWSDADVFAYLKREGVVLPRHYETINDSLDCWACSGHLAHHGAEKLRWTRQNYPDLYPIAAERVRRVRQVLLDQSARIADAMIEADR
jgi:phosphoadenosine phosphosulfate reductase